ncbi:MAG: 16S rRNA (guanine(527)-N(7))-methyltransferase RsmG [Bacteroidetes bacterium]|nr:MAG: 16S rRNA (guanine(527)-N(7))-methyltransferase RsmG [Bacteroidota bacterium]
MDQIIKYFPKLSDQQLEKFEMLKPFYEEWNAAINVISRKDMDSFYERHVLHSMAIAKVIRFKKGTEILDIGTGGGFPGIPLAIMFPKVNFHLVDSIGKKIKVVQNAIGYLGLKNAKAEQIRAEQIHKSYDFVVSRAVTALPKFNQWASYKIRHKNGFNDIPNGILYLKGGEFADELKEINRPHKVYPISDYYEEEFFETKFVVYIR